MTFVDTNYFLRFLLRDNEEQYSTSRTLFEKGILGKEKLFTSIIVFFEINWVLSSFYAIRKEKCISLLKKILRMNYIAFEFNDLMQKAIEIYKNTSLDLEDSFNLVYAKEWKASSFATFDEKLKKQFKK